MLALETLGGGGRQTLPLPVVASGQTVRVEAAWDTTLRPGVYELVVQGLTPQSADGRRINVGETRCRLTLVPRPLPHRMPVVMWGIYGAQNVRKELPRLKDIGFTHCLGFSADMAAIWKAGQPTTPATAASLAANQQMLNQALAQDSGSWRVCRRDVGSASSTPNGARGPAGAALHQPRGCLRVVARLE